MGLPAAQIDGLSSEIKNLISKYNNAQNTIAEQQRLLEELQVRARTQSLCVGLCACVCTQGFVGCADHHLPGRSTLRRSFVGRLSVSTHPAPPDLVAYL